MSKANDSQVAGNHYREAPLQHWDFAASNGLDYFQGQITKYVTRWKKKNGIEDLRKAQHFLQKYLELVEAGIIRDSRPVARELMAAIGTLSPEADPNYDT